MSLPTCHRWKAEYGGAQMDVIRQNKELKIENERLKRLVADEELAIAIWKEMGKEKWQAQHAKEKPWSEAAAAGEVPRVGSGVDDGSEGGRLSMVGGLRQAAAQGDSEFADGFSMPPL